MCHANVLHRAYSHTIHYVLCQVYSHATCIMCSVKYTHMLHALCSLSSIITCHSNVLCHIYFCATHCVLCPVNPHSMHIMCCTEHTWNMWLKFKYPSILLLDPAMDCGFKCPQVEGLRWHYWIRVTQMSHYLPESDCDNDQHLSKFVHINDTYAVARYNATISCKNS